MKRPRKTGASGFEMENEDDLAVFVYGTLMPGGSAWAERCEGRVVEMRRARVRGRLYALNAGYPAVDDERQTRGIAAATDLGWVQGWRLVLRDAGVLAGLDKWEGYLEGRAYSDNEYNRTRVVCYKEDDTEVVPPEEKSGLAGARPSNRQEPEVIGEAWIYVMARERIAAMAGVELKDGVWRG